ncbi:Transcription regulator HTH, LacI [Halomonas sp. R57-5]|uniref:hypothetical protein n=1 Tax=Halomonas sp. R57-5 TaxID=1610576 RepID=UPI0005FC9815|nr:hypothetical protein [Halomonas sp. R57-5]CEP33683.1 Transcription regulator HTH, LacI [Halomonas sp. R57-5]
MQARALRRERSGIIGMILPLYDNRYFSSIANISKPRRGAVGCLRLSLVPTRPDPRARGGAHDARLPGRMFSQYRGH